MQTDADIEARNRALVLLNAAKGKLEYRRHKAQNASAEDVRKYEDKVIRSADQLELYTGEFNVVCYTYLVSPGPFAVCTSSEQLYSLPCRRSMCSESVLYIL